MRQATPRAGTRCAGCCLSLFFALLFSVRSPAALVVSEVAAGTDDIPPAPVPHLQAGDLPGDRGGCIQLTWTLSPDDELEFTSIVPAGYAPTADGQGVVVRRRRISGYRIYRYRERESPRLIAEVEAGTDHYTDTTATTGTTFFYEVRVFDSAHETPPAIEPGSAEDRARSARAVDDSLKPVDPEGEPVLGWFDPIDDIVDFNDFFLFADHFGQAEGEPGFDERFDLNEDYQVDFDDFFLFADHFGQIVANYESIVRSSPP